MKKQSSRTVPFVLHYLLIDRDFIQNFVETKGSIPETSYYHTTLNGSFVLLIIKRRFLFLTLENVSSSSC